ncbi:hypothetical protein [Stappia sp. ES.058]|uniref:cell division protein FtsL n=1 Tax=Stappia sp. ES.058 TaxID=1881061 RepID=UPI00087B254D|nr:hypothetical protein [Stappia sp. ES.058]SDU27079.1 hypothetical protein SAMN05428979_2657 [Stappia sp. ES.058]
MTRYLNVFLVIGVLAAAATVYDMKHDAERAAERVANLQQRIDEEREQLKLLRAEWSLLNDPSRLQKLVERYNEHLNLQPLEVEQITRIEDVPVKPMQLAPIGGASSLGGYAGTQPVVR